MTQAKPLALKVLEGNPGQRRLPTNQPKAQPQAPRCPAWLSREAKAEWRRVVPALDRLGLLAGVDRAALTVYCEAWAQHRNACEAIARDGVVVKGAKGRAKHPALQVARDTAQTIKAFCREFGLTPSARSRMTLPEVDDAELARILD